METYLEGVLPALAARGQLLLRVFQIGQRAGPGQAEPARVPERQVMRRRNARRAGLCEKSIVERITQRLHASARARLRFEHRHLMPRRVEFVRSAQPRKASPHDNDALGRQRLRTGRSDRTRSRSDDD